MFAITQLLGTQCVHAQTNTQDGTFALAGQCSDVLASYVATSSAISLNGPSSGSFSFALDTTHTSTATWDFTNKTETWNLYLTVTSPLLSKLSANPIPIELTQTGALPQFNLLTGGGLNWSGSHAGTLNGASTSGSDSGTFTNPGTAGIPAGDPALSVDFLTSSTLKGTGTFTAGTTTFTYQDTLTILPSIFVVQKGGTFALAAVPEANSLVIAMLGVSGLGALVRRRRREVA
jgi:hypothetical protein